MQEYLIGGTNKLKKVDPFVAIAKVNTVLIMILQELLDLDYSSFYLSFESQLLPHYQ